MKEIINMLVFQKDMSDSMFQLKMQMMQFTVMQYTGTWMQSINKAL
jgi:hypothetical protein